MQEIVCVHLGQAGVQISNAAWELFCIEHGIEANGRLKETLKDDDSQAFKTFFCEAPNGQFVPRCLTIDLEPTVVDEIRTGNYRNLFHPEQIMNGYEDGANNYARGHFTIGKTIIDDAMAVLRKVAENCDSLQGFFLIHSHGGGTGSGFTSLLMDSLNIEYAKSPRIQLSVFPSPIMTTAVVEPYNCILSSYSDIEKSDITILVNNEAIYHICYDLLDIVRPTFSNINRIIAHVFSDLSVSLRFESSLNSDFIQMSTNLIPFPRIHFPLVSHAPLVSDHKADHESMTVQDLTRSIFNVRHQLLSCNTKEGLYMSCVLQYRGNVTPKDVNQAIFDIKRRQEIKFVEWCPTGFKLGINSQPSTCVPGSEMAQTDKSVTMVCNSTAIGDSISQIMNKFDVLFCKRSFVHWFVGEGMEEGEFNEARDEFKNLLSDYEEIATSDAAEEEEDEVTQAPPPPQAANDDAEENPDDGGGEETENVDGGEDAGETDGDGGAGIANDPVNEMLGNEDEEDGEEDEDDEDDEEDDEDDSEEQTETEDI